MADRQAPCDEHLVPTATPIACNLTAIPEADRPRFFAVRRTVLETVEAVAETANGYALEVRVELLVLTEWIAFERACCPFVRFVLTVDPDGPVRLELGGAEGVKDFLRGEFAELGAATLVSAALLVRR
jgi:hypothetical protein